MRLEFSFAELSILKSALENSAIKGSDVHAVSDLLKKLDKGIDKEKMKLPQVPPQPGK